jgi:hypothetical protein
MQAIDKLSVPQKIYTSISLEYPEPPILGAPVLFELIRSYNILNPSNDDAPLKSGSAKTGLKNTFEEGTVLLENPTNYNGFFFKPVTPHPSPNFLRHSINLSNPYILLTKPDIEDNATGLEDKFTTIRDTSKIKNAIDDYWNRIIFYDKLKNAEISAKRNVSVDNKYLGYYPGFHLIYAYMMENTKMFQIFEKIVSLYQHGEDLTIPFNNNDFKTRAWVDNTHLLFFSNSPSAVCNDNSLLGSNFEAMRRNGYQRLFALDLNHGIGENGTPAVAYKRANHTNIDFIPQFENFLKLCWQMMINFSNTSSINTTDLIALQEQANTLQNMLLARRTTVDSLNNYTLLNLSKLEYQSVIMAEWFKHALSYNSPIVVEMGADAVTPAERLNRLGRKVGISSHTKSGNFMDLAPLMATLLRLLELNEIDNDYITAIARPTTRPYALISSILYNYQLATGRDLKNQVMINNNYARQSGLVGI